MSMTELERRCVDAVKKAIARHIATSLTSTPTETIVRAVLAEAGVAELVHACELALGFILYRQGNDAGETVTVSDLRSALAKIGATQ